MASLSLLTAAGCDVTIKDGDVSVRHYRGRATQEWNRKYPLGPAGRFEITNSNGPVEVVAGAPGHVEVAAVITATSMTDERAAEVLRSARIEETVAADRIALVSQSDRRGGNVGVSFKIAVPPDTQVVATLNNDRLKADGLRSHVKAMVVNGEIELTALRGTVDAATVNGRVSVKMAEVTGHVRVESTNGQIFIEMPKEAKATLNLRSVNGSITVTGLNTPEATGRRIRSLESQLNGGGPEIDVRITNGRITIEGK
jgi:putative adhesin